MNQYVSMNDLTAQIWRDAAQWKGWLLAAEQAGPPAFPALLSLPPSVLASALASMRQGAALRPKVDDSATAAVPGCFAGVPAFQTATGQMVQACSEAVSGTTVKLA